jgi:P-type Ca2+ transporter type 2C
LILLPVQILWMNLVTDGLTAVALGLEPVEADVMDRPPRDPKKSLLDWPGVGMIALLGSYMAGVTLWLMNSYYDSNDPSTPAVAQTMAFTGIIIAEKFNVLNFRALRTPLWRVRFFANGWVLIALVGTILLQVCAVYVPFLQTALHTVPIGYRDWGLILMLTMPIILIGELYKWCLRRVE